MAQEFKNPDEEVVLGDEIDHVRLITLNRPRQLNVISSKVVTLLAEYLEKWEKDDNAKMVIIKGGGRAFSAGGDLKMFYDGRKSKDSCLEVVYRMYWLCYHIHTYMKPQVALVHGISMGGGASLMVPTKFSVVTEKTMLPELEKRLISLNSGDKNAMRSAIEEFSINVQIEEESVLSKQSIINECFSKDSVEEIIKSIEAEASKEGNAWIGAVLKGLKRSSPTGLKITLRSIREGRKQTLAECLKKEFRLTINTLRMTISGDVYEGIRALTIDKDNAPKWDPSSLDKVDSDKVDLVFQPFEQGMEELQIPGKEECRWDGKYENSVWKMVDEPN
ncbi:3-hydroxyisobutyryl-CoA hydrolase-like protein 5 isoform X3 [Cornus florida]|uniref:3-hydroxyisobutyryl-CoA hydrolase-like protein 5 isoform X3 n=1 Tax=Cornus florida TaxID=4283 RepID=UPI00289D0416|nr:3-hydroxyisobutyryl-CoA hydrolase-like protein 5 isoform X3 [Cornus florida]